jgi:hypothetical protein
VTPLGNLKAVLILEGLAVFGNHAIALFVPHSTYPFEK